MLSGMHLKGTRPRVRHCEILIQLQGHVKIFRATHLAPGSSPLYFFRLNDAPALVQEKDCRESSAGLPCCTHGIFLRDTSAGRSLRDAWWFEKKGNVESGEAFICQLGVDSQHLMSEYYPQLTLMVTG